MKYLFSLVLLIILLFIAELLLKLFFPFTFATIGHIFSQNAKLYGWGFSPHQIIKVRDPDTGEVCSQPLNNHCWRDIDRSFANDRNTYRILLLGDSVTFGANVPAEKVYARILEGRLYNEGFNVEVINIAYGGWGTDQQLEALTIEGLRYKPHLVIFQFHVNDLEENMFFTSGDEIREHRKGAIPFYYALDHDNQLVRHNNPFYISKWRLKDKIKLQILKSELAKRLYSLYFSYRWRETALSHKKEGNLLEDRLRRVTYHVTRNQIEQLKLVINLENDGILGKYLQENIDKEIDVFELSAIIKKSGNGEDNEKILKILEKRSFHKHWSKEHFYPKKQDINSQAWRLYFALINRAKSRIVEEGGQMAIFCPVGVPEYDWSIAWHRISADATSRKNFLQFRKIIENFSAKNKIGFIENKRYYRLFRNDPHPNIEGHEAMAEDIYDYIIENHITNLTQYRLPETSTK